MLVSLWMIPLVAIVAKYTQPKKQIWVKFIFFLISPGYGLFENLLCL